MKTLIKGPCSCQQLLFQSIVPKTKDLPAAQ